MVAVERYGRLVIVGAVACTFVASSPACGGPYTNVCACTEKSCNRVVVQGHSALASDASVTWRGRAMSIVEQPWLTEAPEGACRLNLDPLNINDVFGYAAPFDDLTRSVSGGCTLEGRRLYFRVELGDLRKLGEGSHSPNAKGDSAISSQHVWECPFSTSSTLIVTGAVGGAEAFPALVTADFARTLELSFTAEDGCGYHESVSVRFTVTAADYEGIADTICEQCEC